MSLNHSTQSGQHPYAARDADLYETPGVAIEALLRVERLPHQVWEPCAARGAIANVLRDRGHAVICSDVKNYGFRLHFQRDFFSETAVPAGCEAIVTNPPFRVDGQFVAHALDLSPIVIVLLRLAFLESERRSHILDSGKLARLHVFKNRLPMMHRDGWAGPRATSAIPFAWFVFERSHDGPITVDRISWERQR